MAKRTLSCWPSPDGRYCQSTRLRAGNKRTAFAALRLFLRANGYAATFDDTIQWADEIIALVEHRTTEEEFVRAIRPFVVER